MLSKVKTNGAAGHSPDGGADGGHKASENGAAKPGSSPAPETDYDKLVKKIEDAPPKISDLTFNRVFGFPEPK